MFTLNPTDKDFLETLNFLLKLLGGVGGIVLFCIGLTRYIRDQKWKRSEFVAKEIREFTSDFMVRNAMYMLDWGSRNIHLFPDKPNYEDRYVHVDRIVLMKALQFHELRIKEEDKDRFTAEEVAIRDTFDHFLSYFERFYQFIEAGLVSKEELEPYLNYWINSLACEMEENSRNVIYHYINQYGFTGTQKLFKIFEKDIAPVTDIKTTVLAS